MTPTLGGSIDATFFAQLDVGVQAALSASSGTYVILGLSLSPPYVSFVLALIVGNTQIFTTMLDGTQLS